MKVAIFDKLMAGGQLALTPLIENYPGYKAIPGPELANLMKDHAIAAGAEIFEVEEILDIQRETELFKLTTVSGNEFKA